ncbi:hypothetical protein [Shewanella sp. DAU305]|uniref:hypothetical protein n=1 Tax=Shewanella sp. DAU305 TaxID=2991940 RepID=UPI002284C8B0|nr:hypothetical protein [Shewanella sp. DAU305]WAL80254.1 hypothetical protein OX890_08990 [Shewanella sp. DAU305]
MNLRIEFVLSLLNRALPPLLILGSISIFEKVLSGVEFTNYLLMYSFLMWVISCFFQSQKNSIIKLCVARNKVNERVSVLYFYLVSLVSFFLVLFFYPVFEALVLIIVIIVNGALYFFGAHLRLQAKTFLFILTDTLAQVFKWLLAIAFVYFFSSVESVFIGFFLGAVAFVYLQYLNVDIDGDICNVKRVDFYEYLKNIIPLLLLDLGISGFIYADRFFQQIESTSTFIIASTISTQSVSIVAGTILMMIYPKISISYHHDRNKFLHLWKLTIKFSFFLILSALPAISLGNWVISLLYNVEFKHDPIYLITSLSLSHAIYYVFMCLAIPLIIVGQQIRVGVILLFSLFLYLFFVFTFAIEEVLIVKLILMSSVTLVLFFYSISTFLTFSKNDDIIDE